MMAAVNRPGTKDTEIIIQALEKEPLPGIPGRMENHAARGPFCGGRGPLGRYRFYMPKSFDVIQGAEICRAPVELKAFKGK